MHNIRYELDTPTSRKVIVEQFTSKEKAAEWLKTSTPTGSKGFDYWKDED